MFFVNKRSNFEKKAHELSYMSNNESNPLTNDVALVSNPNGTPLYS